MVLDYTENPFLKTGKFLHVAPSCTKPLDPAPHTIASEISMMSMNKTILISEVTYSNQAKTVLGKVKMRQVTTTKMVTISKMLISGQAQGLYV